MARVVINKPAMKLFLDTSPGAQAALAGSAKVALESVEEFSPLGVSRWRGWRPSHNPVGPVWRHGWFKKSLRVRKFRDHWRVESTDKAAHIIEWGGGETHPYAPFRRTIRRFHGITQPPRGES
jgi:hypothetical protein